MKAKLFIEDQMSRKTRESVEAIKRRYLKEVTVSPVPRPIVPPKKPATAPKILKTGSTRTLPKNPLHELRKAQANLRKGSVKPAKEINKTMVPDSWKKPIKICRAKCSTTTTDSKRKTPAPFKEISCNSTLDPKTKIVINVKKNGGGSVKKTTTLKEFIEIVQKHVMKCPALAAALSGN